MNKPGVMVSDLEEQINWWDALDTLVDSLDTSADLNEALEKARECLHPDAQWLASLFPVGADVSKERMLEVMEGQGGDPRALFLASCCCVEGARAKLLRSVELGYAPAQALMSVLAKDANDHLNAFFWAEKAAAQGDRSSKWLLGECFRKGIGCRKNEGKAIELFREAAELGDPRGQHAYGVYAFGELEWERYLWWGRAAARRSYIFKFCFTVLSLVVSFERGENGRILHTVGAVIREYVLNHAVFAERVSNSNFVKLQRVVELHDAMLARARRAIACWSVVGRRRRVVKDMRVMIAKMAWKEAWRWGEKEPEDEQNKKAKRG